MNTEINIEWIKPSNLKPNKKNRNKHPADQIDRLAKILTYQGFREPIIVSNRSGLVVCGHGRLKAAKKLKLNQVPVSYQDFEDEDQEYAHMIADNEIARWAEVDLSGINTDLQDLDGMSFDIDLLGIKDFELDIQKDLNGDADDIIETSDNEFDVEIGDIWQLGDHRIMCGDSLNDENIQMLLDKNNIDMVFTDPPYGMNYSGRGKNTSNKILNDNIDPTDFYNIGNHISERYVWGRVENYKHLKEEPRDTIIWKKNNFGMGRGYSGQYEVCFYYGSFSGSDSDVWELAKDSKYQHPTQKPVSLCLRAIKNSKPKGIIFDYFLGSGSTLLASEQANKTCYGMELDPHYCSVIIKRWQEYTGMVAKKIN